MRKFITKAIPIAAIGLFIGIMLSGGLLKKSFGKDDDIPQLISDIIQSVDQKAWKEASDNIEKLDKAWKRVTLRIQFSSERDEINFLSTNIARLRGAIKAEDQPNALMELNEAYNHWRRIGE